MLTAHAPVGPIGEQTVVVTRDLARHHERLRHGTEELQTTTPHSVIVARVFMVCMNGRHCKNGQITLKYTT